MRGFRAITLLAVSVLFGWTLATPAKAALMKKYTYTGNTFDQVSGAFTTNDRVTGWFLIDCGLAGGSGDCSNLPFADYTTSIIDYSFSAGPLTIEFPISGDDDFDLMTNSNMELVSRWNINVGEWYIGGGGYFEASAAIFTYAYTDDNPDYYYEDFRDYAFSGGFGRVRDESFDEEEPAQRGTWTVETVSVPVPAPAMPYLFPGALVVLIALSRRWRRPSL